MSLEPKSYKVLSFDIYGTLIDWETGLYTSLLPLLEKLSTSSPHHPSKHTAQEIRRYILSRYTYLELSVQAAEPSLPYSKVLSKVWLKLAEELEIETSDSEAEKFGATIGTWPAFPDTVEAIKELGKHYKLIVLSNVDKASFARTNSGPLQGVKFDAIYTAEDIGSYKPDPRNFQYLFDHAFEEFGAKKEEILMVAQSLLHDHRPVKKMGMRPSVWIERRPGDDVAQMGGTRAEAGDDVNLAATYKSLGEFAGVIKEAFES
ncbi:HAD-like protein [Glarea lozoyensis ATCC 20868]|uniref:HAD-like protein n=2 Tax=Glarea lozoyensis TaxID=101852 RepID=S3DE03_GLAL2|nr:HAD-like protein [Glarea lozoyensis ATCC 20868]EHL01070.1 putative (S)-2-haloacid dehalogenase [Glarea lozoyensis 74030]EPE35309.1 HAD-like protein [Glarea lozoyensis ATCC 20868]